MEPATQPLKRCGCGSPTDKCPDLPRTIEPLGTAKLGPLLGGHSNGGGTGARNNKQDPYRSRQSDQHARLLSYEALRIPLGR